MQTPKSEIEVLQSVLTKHWAGECEVVGKATTKNVITSLVEGKTSFRPIEGGANFNMVDTIHTLFEAVSLVKICIDAKRSFEKRTGKKPTKEEIAEAVAADENLLLLDSKSRLKLKAVIDAVEDLGDSDEP